MLSQAERERRYAMLSADQRWALARRHKPTQLIHAVAAFILFVVASAVWIPVLSTVLEVFGRAFPMISSVLRDALPEWLSFVLVCTLVFGPQVAGLVYCARASQKFCAMKEVGRTACDVCGYSLMGLPEVRGMVRCPECGLEIDLSAYGTHPDDLIDAPADDAAFETEDRGVDRRG